MKNIAIISSQYFWLPTEPGPSRFYSIAQAFKQASYNIDIITSSFEHHEKKQRDKTIESPFNVIYIDCPSYKNNIGISREISNIIFSYKIKKFLEHYGSKYDIIYCSIPPNNIGAVVGKYCHTHHIPFIVDIEDLWPEAMSMIVPKLLRFLFRPYLLDAERTYQHADGVVGTSEEYSLRAMKNNKRKIPYITVFVGCDVDAFDREAEANIRKIDKPVSETWITYAGSIGHSYAIDNIVQTAKLMQDYGYTKCKFKILGSGPLKEEVENLAKELKCNNIDFLGYIAHPLMAAYLVKSDILINSFAKGVSQSIVNKIGDYLSAGKPMINTLDNIEMCQLVNKFNVGINVEPENPQQIVMAIINILMAYPTMQKNSRMLALSHFNRKNTYQNIVVFAEKLIQEYRNNQY